MATNFDPISTKYLLCMGLVIHREDYLEESGIIDKISSKALEYSLAVGLSCGDATFNIGGPAHDPYFEALCDDRKKLERLVKRVVAYGNRFKGVSWVAL